MSCPSGKRGYRDEIAAKLALAKTFRKKHERRTKSERRVYPCPRCHAWHLTSQGKK